MPRRRVPLAEWRPDVANLDTQFASEALNVFPGLNGYLPIKAIAVLSSALASQPKGGFSARTDAADFVIFAGTTTKLYKLNTTDYTWTDVSRVAGGNYAVPDEEFWSFAQYEDKLVAVNANDDPQVIDVDSGTNFAALAGSPPRARYVGTFNEFLVLNGLTSFPNRTQWSGLGDIEQWTDGTNSSGFQDHPDGGHVTAFSGATGLVLQEGRIRRMTFRQDDLVFQFDILEEDRGCIAPYSIARAGKIAAFLAEEGFYAASAAGSQPIGSQKVNAYFFMDATGTLLNQMVGCADPEAPRMYWAYRSVNNNNAYFDKLIIYDYELDRWSRAEVNLYYIFQAATPGTTLEALDALFPSGIDSMTISLDSGVWQGGDPLIAGFDSSFRLVFFQGSNMEATVETPEMELVPGRRSFVQGLTPICGASGAVARIATKEEPSGTFSWRAETSQNTQGSCRVRANGHYHKARVRVPSGETWSHLQAVDIDFIPGGRR